MGHRGSVNTACGSPTHAVGGRASFSGWSPVCSLQSSVPRCERSSAPCHRSMRWRAGVSMLPDRLSSTTACLLPTPPPPFRQSIDSYILIVPWPVRPGAGLASQTRRFTRSSFPARSGSLTVSSSRRSGSLASTCPLWQSVNRAKQSDLPVRRISRHSAVLSGFVCSAYTWSSVVLLFEIWSVSV